MYFKTLFVTLMVFASTLYIAKATIASKCKGKEEIEFEQGAVNISNCDGSSCRLPRKTQPSVTIRFTPNQDVHSAYTNVVAYIAGVPFPFIGVDGTDACKNFYNADGTTKASCPLKKGETYIYNNSFRVHEIYPKIKLVVHYSLKDSETNKAFACFEMPMRIVAS